MYQCPRADCWQFFLHRQSGYWGEDATIGTNRDLAKMQEILDQEIRLLTRSLGTAPEQNMIEARLSLLSRQRIAVCAAVVNRRIEASNKVIVFSRWISGNGALGGADLKHNRETTLRAKSG